MNNNEFKLPDDVRKDIQKLCSEALLAGLKEDAMSDVCTFLLTNTDSRFDAFMTFLSAVAALNKHVMEVQIMKFSVAFEKILKE